MKFFNSNFFKFTFGFIGILAASLSVLFLVGLYDAYTDTNRAPDDVLDAYHEAETV
jgi:hypothetical protein